METIPQNAAAEGSNEEMIKNFDALPLQLIGETVKQKFLTPEEAAKVTKTDLDIIHNIARRFLAGGESETIDDALLAGTIARTEALKILNQDSFQVLAQDNTGRVISGGKNEMDAMKNAREITAE
jgi:hypothetical protein